MVYHNFAQKCLQGLWSYGFSRTLLENVRFIKFCAKMSYGFSRILPENVGFIKFCLKMCTRCIVLWFYQILPENVYKAIVLWFSSNFARNCGFHQILSKNVSKAILWFFTNFAWKCGFHQILPKNVYKASLMVLSRVLLENVVFIKVCPKMFTRLIINF